MDHSEVMHLPKVDHTPADLDGPSKILMKAADAIEKHGLAKGIQCDPQGRLCMAGAIRFAAGGMPDEYGSIVGAGDGGWFEANKRLLRSINDPDCTFGPANWNNKPERTKDEVVAKLRAAALGL